MEASHEQIVFREICFLDIDPFDLYDSHGHDGCTAGIWTTTNLLSMVILITPSIVPTKTYIRHCYTTLKVDTKQKRVK